MKILLLILMIATLGRLTAHAQTEPFTARVTAESAIVRAAPAQTSAFAASAFAGEVLDVIGRNLDGLWFQVRRPGRLHTLGWISHTVVDYDFFPERLPLTDWTTGVTGAVPLTSDPGFAGFTRRTLELRAEPWPESRPLAGLPSDVVVPVLERDTDGLWVMVSYLGTSGWVETAALRGLDDPLAVPLAVNLPQRVVPVIPVAAAAIIPLEVQLATIADFRAHLTTQADFARQLADFWSAVLAFERMPCEPPDFVVRYLDGLETRRAFPEIEYLAPRTETAAALLNTAIEPLTVCGVFNVQRVRGARNAAANADVIYTAALAAVNGIEEQIRANR